MSKAVIMDRDGTVLKERHYLSDPDGIQIYKGVIPSLKKLVRNGWKLIIGTNQSGVARGYLTLKELGNIHDRLTTILQNHKVKIDKIFFCPHHPNENCDCRKPKIGMLLKAAKKYRLDLKKCVVIGDKEIDIVWGKMAGTKTVLVLTGYGKKAVRTLRTKPDHISSSLPYAIQWILKNEGKWLMKSAGRSK